MSETQKHCKLRRLGYALLERFFALPYALYVNQHYAPDDEKIASEAAPEGEWVTDEASALLERSEQRLQGIEAKGPGLATVCGIVAAAIGLAISLHWSESNDASKVVLVVAGAYSFMSLWAPIRLVGPVRRATVTSGTVRGAADEDKPQHYLATEKMRAAAENDRTTLRFSNQQAASRNDALNAALLFAAWAILTLSGIGNT
jgi:hypothetical protein